jgi:hypothetical protein
MVPTLASGRTVGSVAALPQGTVLTDLEAGAAMGRAGRIPPRFHGPRWSLRSSWSMVTGQRARRPLGRQLAVSRISSTVEPDTRRGQDAAEPPGADVTPS